VGYHHPYSIFYVAVLAAAWYGGLGPGLFATALGAIAIFLLGLLGAGPRASSAFLTNFEFYWVVSLTASVLFEAQRRAEQRARQNAAIASERWRALARETTQRHEAEEAVLRAQEQFRLAFQHAPVGICQLDLDGRILEANPSFCTIIGCDREEVVGRAFSEVICLSEPEDSLQQYQNFLRGDVTHFNQEKLCSRRDGTRIWIALAMSAVHGVGGRRESVIAVLEDITARKRAEEQLLRTQKIESVALLAGGIAHDFNNLLTTVLGNASLAMETVSEGGEVQKMLQGVVTAGERAARLTSQLLAYAGRGAFMPTDIDLSTVADAACQMVRPSVPPDIPFGLHPAQSLPPLHADASQIQQLITNLLFNALEASGGQRRGPIAVETGRMQIESAQPAAVGEVLPGPYLFVRVQDEGEGIEESILPRIFDPFFTTRFVGRGLGLAAVSGIVRRLKGAVLVCTTVGVGSTFTVLFPLAAGRK
jgi:PAS domain S-box-containing protein